jgi:branched-chain amino acid transport system ATP-binding protein
LLQADGITVKFGGLTAVNNVSMAVHRGEVVGLMGPNGAGKTTLFNAILGFNEPASGTVKLFDVDATRMAPHQRARLGVGRTFQVLQLFRELTVFENVLVATHLRNHSGLFSNLAAASGTVRSEVESRESVRQVLRALGLEALAQSPVAGLPFGTLRMVELARALASGAEFILLDEPASGLNEAETDRLSSVVSDLRSMGLSILLIEHDVRMLVGLADYIYVVDQGRLIAEGTAAHIQRDPQVVAAYLGSEVAGGDDDGATDQAAEDEAVAADERVAEEVIV